MHKFTTFILLFSTYFLLSPCLSAQNKDLTILCDVNGISQTVDASRFVSNSTTAVSVAVPVALTTIAVLNKDDRMLKNAISCVAAVAVDGVLTYSLKHVVNRPRPYSSYPDRITAYSSESSLSFPSGHTSLAFSVATSVSLSYPRWYVITPAFLWAGSVGYSRMNLGVHYPSDVMAGAFLGAASAWATYKLNKWYWLKRNNKPLLTCWEQLPEKNR